MPERISQRIPRYIFIGFVGIALALWQTYKLDPYFALLRLGGAAQGFSHVGWIADAWKGG